MSFPGIDWAIPVSFPGIIKQPVSASEIDCNVFISVGHSATRSAGMAARFERLEPAPTMAVIGPSSNGFLVGRVARLLPGLLVSMLAEQIDEMLASCTA